MTVYEGQCHCGAVAARFETGLAPGATDVRADQCTFCRRNGVKTISDPAGKLVLSFREDAVARYRFGTRSADFIICRACGTFVAAIIDGYGVLNVVGAGIAAFADRPARAVDYDGETPEGRTERRRQRWTPLVLEVTA
ncbi:MAG TPA: aldehyde-activating protein [Caulobacteraceae bacterium]|nr:aldehyde-activating protein [Caulobacteraceae bacterium]